MTNEEAKHIIDVAFDIPQAVRRAGEDRTYIEDEIMEAKNMAIQALEQEPCEDAISRQALLDEINRIGIKAFETYNDYSRLFDFVDTLPPVTPQPKTGNWEWVQYDSNPNIGNWHCSECNRIVCGAIKNAANPIFYAYNYCPNCGARMVESEE